MFGMPFLDLLIMLPCLAIAIGVGYAAMRLGKGREDYCLTGRGSVPGRTHTSDFEFDSPGDDIWAPFNMWLFLKADGQPIQLAVRHFGRNGNQGLFFSTVH